MADPNQYYGTIPTIQQAYTNDPRTKLAQSAIAAGTSTAPVATGNWGYADGLARAAQAITGALVNKGQEKRYGQREQAYVQGMSDAAKMANGTQGAGQPVPNPGLTSAAAALSGGAPQSAPMGGGQPPQGMPPQAGGMPGQGANMVPPGGGAPPMGAMPQAGPQIAPQGQQPPFIQAGNGPNRVAVQPASFINPLGGAGRPTSSFGQRGAEFHNGQDWAAPAGTPIMAAGDGVVLNAGTNDRSGNFVRIKHPDGTITGYAHMKDKPGVQAGDVIQQGSVIGSVGSSGHSTGNHLHFTVTDAQHQKVNPANIKFGNAAAQPVRSMQGGAVTPQGEVPVRDPGLEAIPDAPVAPDQAPSAQRAPQEVQTNRIGMAQALLSSGNPDLAAIAQQYLDKGLDEQQDNRRLQSQQQFQQDQTGYSANLADWQNARADSRNAQLADRRGAQDRNFQRTQTANQQAYQTSERLGSQSFQSTENAATRAFQAQQTASDHSWQSGENSKNRENALTIAGIRSDAAGKKQANRNAYFSTPTGLKMQQEAGNQINSNNQAIEKYQRFMDLNNEQKTGGWAFGTPGFSDLAALSNSKLREMHSLANDTTLANLGGSLGTAISDGDRKFIASANVGTDSPRQANTNIARAKIGALRRKNDYLVEFANAQADNTQADFARNWAKFASSTPIVHYDAQGNATGASDQPMTYAQWLNSRPKFDAKGKRIN